MKKYTLLAISILASATVAGAASAADGCGMGYHRNAYGHCRANHGHVLVTPSGLVVGNYYRGHGYWDGHRYWWHRYHDHDHDHDHDRDHGWRYR